ncbi:hypothetical protein [Nitrososphaera sp.]|uniref:hypothetical protein n=1 Tax=Nitrososphaera sp. TaxID=1971748 RepID=UPI0017A6CBC5|nr:hypothetical protein [Nitrososphaera sp.]NWG37111.1 hypothetical protein [Nitrososphaera sp.]
MKVSELCGMIEESIKSGRYPLETDTQKKCAGLLKVTSKAAFDDLRSGDAAVEVRVGDIYVATNFSQNMQHLPGVIEMDVVDSFKLICRKVERIDTGLKIGR